MTAAKAIAALVVGFLMDLLVRHGIDLDPTFESGVLAVVTAIIVFFVPNASASSRRTP